MWRRDEHSGVTGIRIQKHGATLRWRWLIIGVATTPRLGIGAWVCLAPSQQTTRIPTALALRAMVHHQLHQDDDAGLELAYAREAIEPVRSEERRVGNCWRSSRTP